MFSTTEKKTREEDADFLERETEQVDSNTKGTLSRVSFILSTRSIQVHKTFFSNFTKTFFPTIIIEFIFLLS